MLIGMEMKKKWIYGVVLVGIALLSFYGWKLFNGTSYKEEAGTNTNAASKKMDEFFSELEEYYPKLYQKIPANKETFTIPGLVQTSSIKAEGKDEGEADQTEDMTPQGLSFVEDYVVISAYSMSYSHNSVLWVLDRQTGDYVKTIVLPTTSHVGGLAYDNQQKRLWVTTTDDKSASQISSLSLDTLQKEDFSKSEKEVTFEHQYNLAQIEKSSYMAYHDGRLLVGYFDKDEQGHLGIFELDADGLPVRQDNEKDTYQPQQVVDTPEQVQGVAIAGNQIVFSQSYGNKDSKLLFFENPGLEKLPDFEEKDNLQAELIAPPYMQQIVVDGQSIYLLFESSSFKYRINPTVTSIDRIIKIGL